MKEIKGVKYYSEEEIKDGVANGCSKALEIVALKDGASSKLVMVMVMVSAIVSSEIEGAIFGEEDTNEDKQTD